MHLRIGITAFLVSVIVLIFSGVATAASFLLASSSEFKVPNYKAQSDVARRNFEGVNLSLADFSSSDATGSSFRNASLDYANLSQANFHNADLTNVTFRLALIEFTDFSGAVGLTAEALNEACLTQVAREENIDVEGFDPEVYTAPEGCKLWEHVPRG